jgi:hypothetical protein
MNHSECQKLLKEMGKKLGFNVYKKTRGDLFHLASADCVWYYRTNESTADFFREMAKNDGYETIPVVAFEVAHSEQPKILRGSVSCLQILNASASVIVLIGSSLGLRPYLEKLLTKFALGRVHVWTAEDVIKWHNRIIKSPTTPINSK